MHLNHVSAPADELLILLSYLEIIGVTSHKVPVQPCEVCASGGSSEALPEYLIAYKLHFTCKNLCHLNVCYNIYDSFIAAVV